MRKDNMGRENRSPTMEGSSIILLQERFKQLQKTKEMREERRKFQKLMYPNESKDQYHDQAAARVFGVKGTAVSSLNDRLHTTFRDPLALELGSNTNYPSPFKDDATQQIKRHHQETIFPSGLRGSTRSFCDKPDVVDTSLRL